LHVTSLSLNMVIIIFVANRVFVLDQALARLKPLGRVLNI